MNDDRGSGTLLGMLMALVLTVSGTVCWALVAVTTAGQRAAVSADLAGLAAAQSGCEAAAAVASANAARLDQCALEDGDASVVVSVDAPAMLGPLGIALPRPSASARAGPR